MARVRRVGRAVSTVSRAASRVAQGLVEVAGRTPDRTAVTDDDGSLTFAELDALAGTLAAAVLDRVGSGPVAPVPVLVRQDRWSVVAVHGMIRAGVPFVPLDATVPARVSRDLVGRTGEPPLVVAADPDDGLGDVAPVVTVPRDGGDGIGPQPVGGDERATIVFTSGSTGRPKGVVYDWSMWDARHEEAGEFDADYPDGAHRVIAVRRPFHWIGGFGQVLALAVGSSVVTSAAPAEDAPSLFEWVDRTGVTHVQIGPSVLFRRIDRWPAGRRLESVRSVAFGGEGARWEQVASLRGLVASDAVISTSYGSSEAGGLRVCYLEIGPDAALGTGPLPLGPPVTHDRVRFVAAADDDAAGDDALHEIVVCGPVARGYLDDPGPTADLFGVEPDGTRWWRSGDLVRLDPSGPSGPTGRRMLVGRVDDVVKINGALVAPAESERVLADVPGVEEVAVVPRTDGDGVRLVAHVVVEPGAAITPEVLLDRCRQVLAPHVLPRLFVRHEELPQLANGKIDRVALADAPLVVWRSAPPRDAVGAPEQWCLDTVREIIGIEAVGPDDDLWATGLDSMRALELCAAIAEAGYPELTPAALFEHRTVARIAVVMQGGVPIDRSPVTVFNPDGARPPVVIVPPAGLTAFAFRALAESFDPDRPILVAAGRRLPDPDQAPTVDDYAADAHDAIAGRVPADAPVALVGYSASGPVAYRMAAQLSAAGRPVHCVLLDTAPVLTTTAEAGDGVGADRPRGPLGLAGAAARSLRYRVVHAPSAWRRRRLRRFLDAAGSDLDRYTAASQQMFDAGVRAQPGPPTFPVTLFHVAGSEFVTACRNVAPAVVVHEVPGDHRSMLHGEHAPGLAAAVEAAVADLDGSAPGA